MIFVFGSNLAGIHGAGSALEAVKNHGAIPGLGSGRQGNAYAIPTKCCDLNRPLPLHIIQKYVDQFRCYAEDKWLAEDCGESVGALIMRIEKFMVMKIGCGLAGYREYQIAPMFKLMPPNVDLPEGWRRWTLDHGAK